MRIIGGKFKGRTLFTLEDRSIRPTTDRVKESIFNLIQWNVEGSKVLDLFSGSGALGIECISRGAEEVVFVDRARASIEVTKSNLTKVSGKFDVINKDYRSAIDECARGKKKFDLIFLDPPYKKGFENEVLQAISDKNILADEGIIVLERSRSDEEYDVPEAFAIVDERDYGGTTIHILKRATKIAITGTFDPFTLGHKYLVEKACESYDYVYIVMLVNPEKQPVISVDTRLKIIETATKEFKKQVKISYFEGLGIDYLKKYGIKYIYRSVKKPDEAEYEKQIADYNFKNGGIETIFIEPKNPEISSSAVREAVKNNEDIGDMVDFHTQKLIVGAIKKWQI